MKKKYTLISIILILLIVVTVGIIRIYMGKRKIERFEYNGYEFEYDKSKWPKYINYDPDKLKNGFTVFRSLRFYYKDNKYYLHIDLGYGDRYTVIHYGDDKPISKTELFDSKKNITKFERKILDKDILVLCSPMQCDFYEEVGDDMYRYFEFDLLGYKKTKMYIGYFKGPEEYMIDDSIELFNRMYKAKKITN